MFTHYYQFQRGSSLLIFKHFDAVFFEIILVYWYIPQNVTGRRQSVARNQLYVISRRRPRPENK